MEAFIRAWTGLGASVDAPPQVPCRMQRGDLRSGVSAGSRDPRRTWGADRGTRAELEPRSGGFELRRMDDWLALMQGCTDAGMQDARMQGCKDASVGECIGAGLHGCMSTRADECMWALMRGCKVVQKAGMLSPARRPLDRETAPVCVPACVVSDTFSRHLRPPDWPSSSYFRPGR